MALRRFTRFSRGSPFLSRSYSAPFTILTRRPNLRLRAFSTEKVEEAGEQKTNATESPSDEKAEIDKLGQLSSELAKKAEEIEKLRDQLLRALAEMENVRRLAKKDVENAHAYAVSKFASDILEVADNLSLAEKSVRDLVDKEEKALKTLYDGVMMTDKVLHQVLERHGIQKLHALDQKFNPNHHQVLFELQDEKKEHGSVGVVLKEGYKIKDRVLRPAHVGTVRSNNKPQPQQQGGGQQTEEQASSHSSSHSSSRA